MKNFLNYNYNLFPDKIYHVNTEKYFFVKNYKIYVVFASNSFVLGVLTFLVLSGLTLFENIAQTIKPKAIATIVMFTIVCFMIREITLRRR